jgi:hypothetical protein
VRIVDAVASQAYAVQPILTNVAHQCVVRVDVMYSRRGSFYWFRLRAPLLLRATLPLFLCCVPCDAQAPEHFAGMLAAVSGTEHCRDAIGKLTAHLEARMPVRPVVDVIVRERVLPAALAHVVGAYLATDILAHTATAAPPAQWWTTPGWRAHL